MTDDTSDADVDAAVTVCSSCGTQGRVGARFCVGCGMRLSPGEHDDTTVLAATASPRRAIARSDDAVRGCPSCGRVNPSERELCHACGVDLDTGDRPPSIHDHRTSRVSTTDAPVAGGRAWRWSVPVLAVLLVVAAVVGGLWYARLGPFAQAPDALPGVEFPAARYRGEAGPMLLSDVATATTRAPVDGVSHLPEHLVDQNPATAWHADGSQRIEGLEETIDLYLDAPGWVDGLVVGNGDHRDGDAFAGAGRVQRARIALDGDVEFEVVLLDLGREPQVVTLPEPVLTTTLRFEILQVIPGTDWPDPALSRLEVLGWQADGQDADLARERAAHSPAAGPITLSVGGR